MKVYVTVLFLLLVSCLNINSSIEISDFSQVVNLDQNNFDNYVIQQKRLALVKIYKEGYCNYDTWDYTQKNLAEHYEGKLLTAKIDYTNSPEICKKYIPQDGCEQLIIFNDGQIFQRFKSEQPYSTLKVILDSLLNIPLPPSTPELEITWTHATDSLSFGLTNSFRVFVIQNKIRILFAKDKNIYSTVDGKSWSHNVIPSSIVTNYAAMCADSNEVWGTAGTTWYYQSSSTFNIKFFNDSVQASNFAGTPIELIRATGTQVIKFGDSLKTIGGSGEYVNEHVDNWHIRTGDSIWVRCVNNGGGVFGHSIIFLNDRFILTGGTRQFNAGSNTLVSTDGDHWNSNSSIYDYTFPSRAYHASVVVNNIVILLGGQSDKLLNDGYFTKDIKNWYKIKQINPFTPRKNLQCVYFKNKLWLFGGNGLSDLWIGEITESKNIDKD